MTILKKSDFYYDLPPELIAQIPLAERDGSRLMAVNRQSGEITHSRFRDIADFLNNGDLLVLNDSKVFPARLYGKDGSEILLLEQKDGDIWECIGRKLKKGAVIELGYGVTAEITDILDNGNRLVRFDYEGDFFEILEKIGSMPTPPYITEKLADNSRYNTVYARETGSAAAPTAGLHFTGGVFKELAEKGVDTAYVTLHVGLGTFRPVKAENISEHIMHAERFTLPDETARKITDCKNRGGRVIAVGTTSCRVLESIENIGEICSGCSGTTDIFITPGYGFRVIDGLITNFHLPESTLIMLVSAFLGRENTLAAYKTAIRERYRFFSFGDAMLIL